MVNTYDVNLADLIDQQPISRLQIVVIVLCGLVALFDGFDLLVIGVAAPAMTKALHIAPKQFGSVLSAALLGLMVGAFCLGPIADRFGRRGVLIFATATFGFFTLLTGAVTNLEQLLCFRFLTGVGLGGAMPAFISLAAEYTPRSRRETVIALLWTGFPLGSVIAGLLASRLIDAFGWSTLFYIGGVFPILLSVVLFFSLPESFSYLIRAGAPRQSIQGLLPYVFPGVRISPAAQFAYPDEAGGVSVINLFTQARGLKTVFLWLSYFGTFLVLVTNVIWTPTLLRVEGINVARSAIAVAGFAMGSVVGTPLWGFLSNRLPARALLPTALMGGTLSLVAIGFSVPSIELVIGFQILAGFFLGLGSSGLIAVAATFYPSAIRSAGTGWAMGVGRFGSFVGPLVVGAFVNRNWQIEAIFVALAAPIFSAAVFTVFIQLNCPKVKIPSERLSPTA
jgi:MFS transporter, AAHS family, 4-hydroxybenzoate transporter